MKRGKLGKGRTQAEDTAGVRPALAADDTVIVEPTGRAKEAVGGFVRGIIGLTILILMILALTYLAIAGTVATPLKSGSDWILVMRNAWPIGSAPPESVAFIQAQPVTSDPVEKLTQAVTGVPDGGVVTIIASPGMVVKQGADGTVVVNDQATGYVGAVDARFINKDYPGLLDEAYLAWCVSGSCGTPGSVVIIPQNFIVGEARGILAGTEGLSPIPVPGSPSAPVAEQPSPAAGTPEEQP